MFQRPQVQMALVALGMMIVGISVGFLAKDSIQRIIAERNPPKIEKKMVVQRETNPETFLMTIQGKLADVQKCYDAQLERGLKKSGQLVIRWNVDKLGKSSQFEEEVNELGSSELYDCTTVAIQSWNFPKNHPIAIRYTFKMKEIVAKEIEKEKIIREVSRAQEIER